MGCRFPRAANLEQYWVNLRDGVDAITDVPPQRWRPQDYFDEDPRAPDKTYARRGGFIEPIAFDPLQYGIAPRDIEAVDTTQLLGLVVAREALEDAGYGSGQRHFERARCSVILGVTGTLPLVIPLGARLGHPIWRKALQRAGIDEQTREAIVADIADSYVGWQENSFPGLLGNVAAGRIASRLDLHGTNCILDAACASSLAAIEAAALELRTGQADMVISGGLDTFNDIFMYVCFSKTPALSPTGDCRPFAGRADGTVLGEGLGVVVLKRLEDAQRDGDRIYALIEGVGSASDGRGKAVYAPSADGQVRCLKSAYADAGVDPSEVSLLEAHGTGTAVGDATELAALEQVFGHTHHPSGHGASGRGASCALGSVKSMIGHTKAACGVAGLIKAALALHHRVIPPTLKLDEGETNRVGPDAYFHLPRVASPWITSQRRLAGVSAFGFGGTNYHCVLSEYPTPSPSRPDAGSIAAGPVGLDWGAGDVLLWAASADDPATVAATLRRQAQLLAEATDDASNRARAAGLAEARALTLRREARRSRASFATGHAYRVTMVLGLDAEPTSIISVAEALEAGDLTRAWPQGVFVGHSAATVNPGVAVCFPHHGPTEDVPAQGLALTFPEFVACLSEIHGDAGSAGVRTPMQSQPRSGRQVAAMAAELGLWRCLQRFSLPQAIAVGYGAGAITAACAAGAIDASAGAQLWSSPSVTQGLDTLPWQPVDHPTFLGAALHATGTPVAAESRRQFAEAVERPEPQLSDLRAALSHGLRIFVELGPEGSCAGALASVAQELGCEGCEVQTLATGAALASSSLRPFAQLVAQLAALGVVTRLSAWDPGPGFPEAPVRKPSAATIYLTGANHRSPDRPRADRPRADRPRVRVAEDDQNNRSNAAAPVSPRVVQPSPQAPPPTAPPAANVIETSSAQPSASPLAMLIELQRKQAEIHGRFLDGQRELSSETQRLLERQQQLLAFDVGPK